MTDTHGIFAPGIAATISADGAELVSLRADAAGELLWQAGSEWPRHAPVLFPTVGRLKDDVLRHDNRQYPMGQHGFARDRRFEWIERGSDRASLRLTEDEESLDRFPFAFVLDMSYAVGDGRLTVTTRVGNPGRTMLPCGVGAHPGFRWPLVDGVEKSAHAIEFEMTETGPARSVVGGLLGAEKPLPFDGRSLPLDEALFASDALVMPGVASRSLSYVANDAGGGRVASLDFSWQGYKDLGIWSKPGGAPFLCIEPWYGMASPADWDGEFTEKPGILQLAPGEVREMSWSVRPVFGAEPGNS